MNEDTFNNWSFPVLPGNLLVSIGCLEWSVRVQVREVPTSDESYYLVGIAHIGSNPAVAGEWHNLHTTPERAIADSLARKVRSLQDDSYGADMRECEMALMMDEPVDAARIAQGRLFGDKADFLRKAAEAANSAIADTLRQSLTLVP